MRAFALLAVEALRDAVRRRIAGAILVVCVLSVLMIDSCTGCSPRIDVNGEVRELSELAGAAGIVTFVMLSLWIATLAGVLASDHLRETLEDGSAALALARPVGRGAFALARLAGALVLALGAGAVLLGSAGFLLATRQEVPPGPALGASVACALAAVAVGSFAMAASLVLPRLPTVLGVFVGVGLVALANAVGLVSRDGGGFLAALDRYGPPLASGVAAQLASWSPAELPLDDRMLLARLLAWALAGLALLVWGARRVEIAS
jgi:ABC-type transport system involved in multi-copper enzyme maturation permease subunit